MIGIENPDKNGTQRELTRKKIKKYDNDGGSKSNQKYKSRLILGNKRWWMNRKTLLFKTKYWVSLDIGA